MTPLHFLFFSFLFSLILLIVTAGNHENCPSSFTCGKLGTFRYPFTMAEHPECGLLPIQGCLLNATSPKLIQLGNNSKSVNLTAVVETNKIITIYDDGFHTSLDHNECDTLHNNYTLPPPSPLLSMYIKYNVTLFKCNHNPSTKPPSNYVNLGCRAHYGYEIYYDRENTHPDQEAAGVFSGCSVVQFASKDSTNTKDVLSFVSAEMVLEIVLSHDCDDCFNHRGGLCRLDNNNHFYCHLEPKSSKALKIGLGIGLGVGVTLLCILILVYLFRRKHAPSDLQYQSRSTHSDLNDLSRNPDPESGRDYFGVPLFSHEELSEATNNFHHSTQVGHGGFGTVYYGKLRDGREVAVKRLYDHNYRKMEQFMNEIEILTGMRHRNLVSLYGCTSRHSRKLLLVYEYVSNGTVAAHLHGDLARSETLPWNIRMKIAIETASSLSYLHASDIIHRDVKTNNILLDHHFCVKVADFGLSRLFPSDVTHVSTAPQGTPGYVDPEYYRCYQLTSKSDVYSFGVVLVELISSKPAVDMDRHKDEINLSDLAINKIQKSAFSELVDPSLGFDLDSEVKRMIVSVAELAFQCLQRDRALRPSMDEVLRALIIIESGKIKDEAEEVEAHVHTPPSPDLNDAAERIK
ncbi:hypothetical protein HN51_029432 [Arachis hypogaea]|uniref:LEAF RUST 10 DISEASE-RESISTANCEUS RECEPTOR-LIKE PROTEIN KINASE-like 1.1 n=1 Tax=Arachis hypogaea TaxID=3818 RepID=UPI000DEC56B6|nr:LEAF RUST 10 DISEASE-RESISTANCE LOCUS RECEPTOR-LIKE PROTEIN KINASE-like 1.1 [Arachis hypogaea]QHO36066.1 uncharacterized protein DS421_9g280650 [Arachis hypogaea]